MALVPEGRGVFARMTIMENLQMGAFVRTGAGEIAADIEQMFTLFPRLRERTQQLAGTMSGGEQQMLAMARAPTGRRALVLPEDTATGPSPILVEQNFQSRRAG